MILPDHEDMQMEFEKVAQAIAPKAGHRAKRTNAEAQHLHLKEWRGSGMDKKSYCEKHGIRLETFQKWVRQHQFSSVGHDDGRGFEGCASHHSKCIESLLPNGVRMRCSGLKDAMILAMVKELSSCKFN